MAMNVTERQERLSLALCHSLRITDGHRATNKIGTTGFMRAMIGALFLFVLNIPSPLLAQTLPAPLDAPVDTPIAIDPFAPELIIDFREEMRKFVGYISAYARGLKPSFIVIAKGGLDLVNKPDPNDDTVFFPALAYINALDGVLETNLLNETVTTPDGKPDTDLEALLKFRKLNEASAATYGLKLFNMGFSTDPKTIDKFYDTSAKKGYVPFVGESPALGKMPRYPAKAFHANSISINAVPEIQNFLYIANSQSIGTIPDFIQALRKTNHDALVVDVFHEGKPLTRNDVESLKYKRLGSRRLVFAEIDISTASTFRYYWGKNWGAGKPPYIYKPFRQNAKRYHTIYWDQGWKSIIAGDTKSYLYGIIDLGFDGIVLKGVDEWRYYKAGGDQQ